MPGQTTQNTKIPYLKTELHMTATEWKKITEKLNKKNLEAERITKVLTKRQQMRKENQAMVDSWDDSLLVKIFQKIITLLKNRISSYRICIVETRKNVQNVNKN